MRIDEVLWMCMSADKIRMKQSLYQRDHYLVDIFKKRKQIRRSRVIYNSDFAFNCIYTLWAKEGLLQQEQYNILVSPLFQWWALDFDFEIFANVLLYKNILGWFTIIKITSFKISKDKQYGWITFLVTYYGHKYSLFVDFVNGIIQLSTISILH